MKKLLIVSLALALSACATSSIDITNRNAYGLKCSANAKSAPNWENCMLSAKQLCGVQQVSNVQQLPPTGSGQPDDAYFMAFSCQ